MQRILLILTLAALGAACERADKKADVPTEIPSAEEIMEAHIAAMGGREAFAQVDAIRVTAEMAVERFGFKGTVMIAQRRPASAYTRVEVDGAVVDEEGCDGTVCWEKSDEGVRLLEGDELADRLWDARLDGELGWRERYATVEVVGPVDFAGRGAWKVRATPAAGAPVTLYFDRKTRLELGYDKLQRDPGGERMATTKYLSWETYGVLRQPRSAVLTTDGVDYRINVQAIELDPDLPPQLFDLPPEVKALR